LGGKASEVFGKGGGSSITPAALILSKAERSPTKWGKSIGKRKGGKFGGKKRGPDKTKGKNFKRGAAMTKAFPAEGRKGVSRGDAVKKKTSRESHAEKKKAFRAVVIRKWTSRGKIDIYSSLH